MTVFSLNVLLKWRFTVSCNWLGQASSTRVKRVEAFYHRDRKATRFAHLEWEFIDRETYATRSEARLGVFDFVEGWYNPHRLQSAFDYQSPMSYEEEHHSRED